MRPSTGKAGGTATNAALGQPGGPGSRHGTGPTGPMGGPGGRCAPPARPPRAYLSSGQYPSLATIISSSTSLATAAEGVQAESDMACQSFW